jgi:UrcA family protein
MTHSSSPRLARLVVATATACALAALPLVPATAAPQQRSITVRYDDLNLGADRGVRTLYARLQRAAEQVCPDVYTRDPARASQAHACQAEAIAAAVAQVQSPRLAALHARGTARG